MHVLTTALSIRNDGTLPCIKRWRHGNSAMRRAIACVDAGARMIFQKAIIHLGAIQKSLSPRKSPVPLANITAVWRTPLFSVKKNSPVVGVDLVGFTLWVPFVPMNKAALTSITSLLPMTSSAVTVSDLMQTRMSFNDIPELSTNTKIKLDALFIKKIRAKTSILVIS